MATLDAAAFVETVLGPIAPDALGPSFTHEHLFTDLRFPRTEDASLREQYSEVVLDNVSEALAELQAVFAAGGRTLVEVTTAEMGRQPDALRSLSRDSGVNIVCTTGFYVQEWHPEEVHAASIEELAEGMIRELNQGIPGTTVRAGIIKVSSSASPLDGTELKGFRAAARAQKTTGVALTTHNPASDKDILAPTPGMGMEQLDVLERDGVDPARVILGHCDMNPQLELHVALARRGAYVQYDQIGGDRNCQDSRRAELIVDLVGRGLGSHILLGHDFGQERYFRSRGGPGYDAILRDFIPLLRSRGCGEPEIQMLLVDNPRQALTRRGPRPS